MNRFIQQIQTRIAPIREQIINHPVYKLMSSPEDLRAFMQLHVFAVWDFMSLLKSLQQNLTCTSSPWFPKGTAEVRYLINEIVVGEESDVDQHGQRTSHFELYINAMREAGADCGRILGFIEQLQAGASFEQAYQAAQVPTAAQQFVNFTFEIIHSGKDYLQAAIFTFGREDLIPNMFYSIVGDLQQKFPDSLNTFKYYLDRHIEIDGDEHSHLALEMCSRLCGDDEQKWAEAEQATLRSLQKRLDLWDAVYQSIQASKLQTV